MDAKQSQPGYPNLSQMEQQPPPYEAPPPNAVPIVTIVTQQPLPSTTQFVVASGPTLSPDSCPFTCPQCHNVITTDTIPTPGVLTYLACFLLCIFGCDLGCCFIPCCVRDCQDIEHRCPVCKNYFGKYRRM